jgi:hypothetical protein
VCVPRVFIAYRPVDRSSAEIIYNALCIRLKPDDVFLDERSLQFGDDVRTLSVAARRQAEICIAVIASPWNRSIIGLLSRTEDDIVFFRGARKRIVPVLIGDVTIRQVKLPQRLRFLENSKNFQIRKESANEDMHILADTIAKILDESQVVVRDRRHIGPETGRTEHKPGPEPTPVYSPQIADSLEVEPDPEGSEETEGIEVSWSSDSPSDTDLLRRDSLAQVLDKRIRQALQEEPDASLLVHLNGAWGSGKSTVLKFLSRHLGADKPFLVVWFDAWQQSRVSPPWWALLTTLRQHVFADRKFFPRIWLRLRELAARARVSGAPFVFSVVLLVILTAGVGAFTLWLGHNFYPTTVELVRLFTPAVAMATFLLAGTKIASRVLLWNSARGARLFEQSDSNPMRRVTTHFAWLLQRSRKPVVFFIDDLDRCREDFVVEFLDSVHTLVRDAPRSHHSHTTPAAYFVIAADGSWIRQSYLAAYKAFEQANLGYLFTDKLFQLNVPMPALSGSTQSDFLGSLLGVTPPALADVHKASEAIRQASGNEKEIVGALSSLSPPVREAVAGEAALALAEKETQRYTEHALRKFAPLLLGNPRSIKLFLNTYSILRSVHTLEGGTVAPDTLALWSIIRVRWPSIADFLQHNPDAIEGIKDHLWCSDHFPEELRAIAVDKELRRVVTYPEGGPLRADLIRGCFGA